MKTTTEYFTLREKNNALVKLTKKVYWKNWYTCYEYEVTVTGLEPTTT